MTIVAKNVKAEFLPALKALFKAMDAKVKVQKTNSDKIKEWDKEVQEILRDYKAGKINAYTDIKEMHRDILRDE